MENDRSPVKEGRFFSLSYGEGQSSDKSEHFNQKWFRLLLDRMMDKLLWKTGAEGIRAVFLCGSLATGEGSVILVQGKPLFISDLDLVMVVDSGRLHRKILGMKKELGAVCEASVEEASFAGGVSVGVRHTSELPGLPPSPLVMDMKERALTLYGDQSLKNRIGVERVSEAEGIRLLENRISGFLGSAALRGKNDNVSKVLLAYSIARVYTDILSVFLIYQGRYIPGYRARLKLIEMTEESLSYPVPEDLMDKMNKWTGYKISPYFPDPEWSQEDHWQKAGRDLIYYWRVFRSGAEGAGKPPAIEELLGEALSRHSLRDRIRRWSGKLGKLQLLAGLPGAVFINRGILRFTPREMINLYGVGVLEAIIKNGEEYEVRYPDGNFGFKSDKAGIAAAELYNLWKNINK